MKHIRYVTIHKTTAEEFRQGSEKHEIEAQPEAGLRGLHEALKNSITRQRSLSFHFNSGINLKLDVMQNFEVTSLHYYIVLMHQNKAQRQCKAPICTKCRGQLFLHILL